MKRILFSPDAADGSAPQAPDSPPENPKQIAKLQKQIESMLSQLQEAQNLIDGKNREQQGLLDENKQLRSAVDVLKGNVDDLESKLEKLQAAEAQRAKDEKEIIEKMRHGLSRGQAIAVIARQKAFDEAKAKAPAKPAAKK